MAKRIEDMTREEVLTPVSACRGESGLNARAISARREGGPVGTLFTLCFAVTPGLPVPTSRARKSQFSRGERRAVAAVLAVNNAGGRKVIPR